MSAPIPVESLGDVVDALKAARARRVQEAATSHRILDAVAQAGADPSSPLAGVVKAAKAQIEQCWASWAEHTLCIDRLSGTPLAPPLRDHFDAEVSAQVRKLAEGGDRNHIK